MGVVITRDDIIAYAEVDYVIKHMNERYQDMVPVKLREFFETYKEPDYDIYVNPKLPLANQGLKKYTLEILALLHLKYWCQDEDRKKQLYNMMKQNEMEIEARIREQYGVENLFQTADATIVNSEEDLKDAEPQDFSKPKGVTRVDLVSTEEVEQKETGSEDTKTDGKNSETSESASSEDNNLTSINKTGFFERIKSFFSKLFKKNGSVE